MRRILSIALVIVFAFPLFAVTPARAQDGSTVTCLPEGAPEDSYSQAMISLKIGGEDVPNSNYWYRVSDALSSAGGCSVSGLIAISNYSNQAPDFTGGTMFMMMSVNGSTSLSVGSPVFLTQMGLEIYSLQPILFTLSPAEGDDLGWWKIETLSTGPVVFQIQEPEVLIRFEAVAQ